MKKLSIGVDMDDVIADTGGRIVDLYEEFFGERLSPDQIAGKHLVDVIPEEHIKTIRASLFDIGFFRNLPVMKDSQAVLKEMYERHEVFIISAAMEFPNSLKDKYEWLGEHFPFIHWKKIIFCGDKHFMNTDYLIDDHAKNLVNFKGNPLLYTATHNLHQNTYPRVNNWEEIGQMFL